MIPKRMRNEAGGLTLSAALIASASSFAGLDAIAVVCSACLAAFALLPLRQKAGNHYLHKLFSKAAHLEEDHRVVHGTRIRVSGLVEDANVFLAPISRQRAVLVRTRQISNDIVGVGTAGTWDVLRGNDFLLRRSCGQSLFVSVKGAYLAERSHEIQWRNSDVTESVIAPGDTVEVTGVFDYEVDPDGERSAVRDVPMRVAVRSGPGIPLVVRRSAESRRSAQRP